MIEYARYFGRWSNRDKDYIYQPLVGGNHTAIGDCQAALKLLEQMARSEIIDTTKEGFREKSEWS
jgi:DNA polymerase III subunit epsilon